MTIDERTRHDMYLGLELLSAHIDHEIASTKLEIRAEMRHEINRLIMWLIPTIFTAIGITTGITVAAAQLF